MELESLDVVIPVTGRGSVGGCDGGSTCDNTNKRGEKGNNHTTACNTVAITQSSISYYTVPSSRYNLFGLKGYICFTLCSFLKYVMVSDWIQLGLQKSTK